MSSAACSRYTACGVLVAAALALAAASPVAEAKGKRSGSSSSGGSSSSSKSKGSDESSGGTSVNINLNRNASGSGTSGGTAGASGQFVPMDEATGAKNGLSAADVAARNAQDKTKFEADYATRKAEYDREKLAKSGATPAKPADPLEGKDGLKAAFAAVTTLPAGGNGQIFKVVDASGRILFTDQVPNQQGVRVFIGTGGTALGESTSVFKNLPTALAAVVDKFPVVLYSGNNCNPCGQARAALVARGVPFQERTVRTNADIEALGRITGGDATLPLITVGGQQIRGWSDMELDQTLDAADYPKNSALPPNFRNPPATALVKTETATAAAAAPSNADAATAPASQAQDGIVLRGRRAGQPSPEERAAREAQAAQAASQAAAQAANPAGIRF